MQRTGGSWLVAVICPGPKASLLPNVLRDGMHMWHHFSRDTRKGGSGLPKPHAGGRACEAGLLPPRRSHKWSKWGGGTRSRAASQRPGLADESESSMPDRRRSARLDLPCPSCSRSPRDSTTLPRSWRLGRIRSGQHNGPAPPAPTPGPGQQRGGQDLPVSPRLAAVS